MSGVLRIACVHQGYELYGSDRCFAESVAAIRAAYPNADIEVTLPRPGPIVSLLDGVASRIVFEPIWVLRRRNLAHLATVGLARLPAALRRAVARFRANDLVYINTTVVLDHLVAAHWFPGRALVHVHELAEGRTLAVLRRLILWSRGLIVFNSRATERAFMLPAGAPARVIYNGIAGPDAAEPVTYDGVRRLRVAMLGRISRNKGQEVLLEAVASLPAEVLGRLEVRIVGSAFEDVAREAALHQAVREGGLADVVTVEPFVNDAAPVYRWADIVVVPTRQVESLGRVAIEAMAFGRPPIASAVGGLVEVVEDGRTGWLIPADNVSALANCLRGVIENPAAWRGFAETGRARYEALFSMAGASTAIAEAVRAAMR